MLTPVRASHALGSDHHPCQCSCPRHPPILCPRCASHPPILNIAKPLLTVGLVAGDALDVDDPLAAVHLDNLALTALCSVNSTRNIQARRISKTLALRSCMQRPHNRTDMPCQLRPSSGQHASVHGSSCCTLLWRSKCCVASHVGRAAAGLACTLACMHAATGAPAHRHPAHPTHIPPHLEGAAHDLDLVVLAHGHGTNLGVYACMHASGVSHTGHTSCAQPTACAEAAVFGRAAQRHRRGCGCKGCELGRECAPAPRCTSRTWCLLRSSVDRGALISFLRTLEGAEK